MEETDDLPKGFDIQVTAYFGRGMSRELRTMGLLEAVMSQYYFEAPNCDYNEKNRIANWFKAKYGEKP